MKEVEIGIVQDYFSKIGVAAIEITSGTLKVGDKIHFLGHTTDFTDEVKSMQIEHESVEGARRGAEVGIKVGKRCRKGDRVFKLPD